MSTVSSISRVGRTEPFDLQVGRGQIALHYLLNVQGYNDTHGTTFRAVWEKSDTTDYVYPSSAVDMTFSSTLSETLTMRVDAVGTGPVPSQR